MLLDIVEDIGEGLLHRSGCLSRPVEIRLFQTARCLTRSSIVEYMAVRHYHYHRQAAAGSYEIVQNLRCPAQVAPGLLIPAHAVQQIKHRIPALVAVIARRSVDRHAADRS